MQSIPVEIKSSDATSINYLCFWFTGNNRSALNDATVAWKLQPTYMKAIVRGRYE